jgi:hypothetical protein
MTALAKRRVLSVKIVRRQDNKNIPGDKTGKIVSLAVFHFSSLALFSLNPYGLENPARARIPQDP